MPKFVVYTVWTEHKIVEAQDIHEAYEKGEPTEDRRGLTLSNWQAVEIPAEPQLKPVRLPYGMK